MKFVIRRFGQEVFTDEQADDGQYLIEAGGQDYRFEGDVEVELRGTWTQEPKGTTVKAKPAAKSNKGAE